MIYMSLDAVALKYDGHELDLARYRCNLEIMSIGAKTRHTTHVIQWSENSFLHKLRIVQQNGSKLSQAWAYSGTLYITFLNFLQ